MVYFEVFFSLGQTDSFGVQVSDHLPDDLELVTGGAVAHRGHAAAVVCRAQLTSADAHAENADGRGDKLFVRV